MSWIFDNSVAAAFSGINISEFTHEQSQLGKESGDIVRQEKAQAIRNTEKTHTTIVERPLQPIPLGGEDEEDKGDENKDFTFSLNPFSLAIHGLKLPMVGLLSLTIRKTKKRVKVWTSFLYKMLPVPIFLLPSYKSPIRVVDDIVIEPPLVPGRVICPECQLPTMLVKATDKPTLGDHLGNLCPCDLKAFYPRAFIEQAGVGFGHLDPNFGGQSFQEHQPAGDMIANVHRILGFDPEMHGICSHEDLGETSGLSRPPWIVKTTGDGLGLVEPANRQRVGTRHKGLRCTICFTSCLHGLHPKLLATFDLERARLPANNLIRFSLARLVYRWKLKVAALKQRGLKEVVLVSLSADRLPTFVPRRETMTYLIIYNDPEVKAKLELNGPAGYTLEYFWVPLPYPTTRYLASYRIFLPMMANIPFRFYIVNEIELPFFRQELDYLKGLKHPVASICTGCLWPFFAGNAYIESGFYQTGYMKIALHFYTFGGLYGWDEVMPVYQLSPVVATLGRVHPIGLLAPQVDYDLSMDILEKIRVSAQINVQGSSLVADLKFDRRTIFLFNKMLLEHVDDSRLTFWHVLSDPRPIQPRRTPWEIEAQWRDAPGGPFKADPRDTVPHYKIYKDGRRVRNYEGWNLPTSMPLDNVLQELVASIGGIRIFVFGTRGDFVPMQAYAALAASLVPHVSYVELNTPEEANFIMRCTEERQPHRLVPITLEAVKAVSAARTGINLCPNDIAPFGTAGYSYKPPPDIIYPFKIGFSPLIEAVLTLATTFSEPIMTIGAYARPGFVPRSANGQTFLVAKRNEAPKGSACIVQGSSTIPIKGYPEAVRLGECDHEKEFSKYEVVICPGGAGVVQTAAASGCRVVTTTSFLDRGYRDPHDAGLGVYPGVDPDNFWLALAKIDIRFLAFWLRKNLFRPDKLLSFYGSKPILLNAFRIMMLYLLYSRVQKNTIISTDPLTTLLLTLRPREFKITFLRYLIVYLVAVWVDEQLNLMNVSYYYIFVNFFKKNIELASSPLAIYIAQERGLFYGFISNEILKNLAQVGFSYGRTWRYLLLGGLHPADPCFLEFSLRYHYIPVIHVALVCPSRNKRYEGGHYTIDKSQYVFMVREGGLSSNILIPTNLGYDDMLTLPNLSGPYGPAWNCVTGLYTCTAHLSEQMGVARGYLLMAGALAGGSLLVTITLSSAALWFWEQLSSLGSTENQEQFTTFSVFTRTVAGLFSRFRVNPEYLWRDTLSWYTSLRAPFGGTLDLGVLDIEDQKLQIAQMEKHNASPAVIQQYKEFLISQIKLANVNHFVANAIFI